MAPRGGLENGTRSEVSRRMIVTASGLTLLTACAGKSVAAVSGPSSGGGPSAAGTSSATSSSAFASRVPSPRSSAGAPTSAHGNGTTAAGHPGANPSPTSPPPSAQQPTGGQATGATATQAPNAPGSTATGDPLAPATGGSSPQAPNTPATQAPGPPTGVPAAQPQFYVHGGNKAIALTIDDGPSSFTPQVLALLAQYKISATFCMLGGAAKTHAGLVQEVVAAGHKIANHTFTHADLSKLDIGAVRSEITRANDALAAAGAHPPAFFRAPYGAWSPAVLQVCQELNLKPLDWSVDPQDWSRPGTDKIVNNVLTHTHTGSIILEHDGGGDRSQTVAALTRFLPKLLAQGYRFVQP